MARKNMISFSREQILFILKIPTRLTSCFFELTSDEDIHVIENKRLTDSLYSGIPIKLGELCAQLNVVQVQKVLRFLIQGIPDLPFVEELFRAGRQLRFN